MREYEIVYILDSTLDQDAVNAKLEAFHAALGGEVTTLDHWGVRQLAYPIQKSQTGYYVIVHVTADPTGLPEFERLVKLDEETMRYLVVLNEGQPTTGASVLAERAAVVAAEDGEADGETAPAATGNESSDDARAGNADAEAAPEAGDAPEAEEAPKADEAPKAEESSGPPVFSGARGRRRRHEGPPIVLLNYKDVTTLSRFLTEQGKILPKRTTKVTARFQRQLGTAVKRARHLALLPYIRDHGA